MKKVNKNGGYTRLVKLIPSSTDATAKKGTDGW